MTSSFGMSKLSVIFPGVENTQAQLNGSTRKLMRVNSRRCRDFTRAGVVLGLLPCPSKAHPKARRQKLRSFQKQSTSSIARLQQEGQLFTRLRSVIALLLGNGTVNTTGSGSERTKITTSSDFDLPRLKPEPGTLDSRMPDNREWITDPVAAATRIRRGE